MRKSSKFTRLFYENFNSLNHNWKVHRLNSLRNTMHLDLVCGTEPNRKRSASCARSLAEGIFNNTPYIQTVSSSNHHENFGPKRRGGTFMATGGDLATRVARTGGDFTSLGRWSWILVGSGDRLTRIITAYQPCRSRKDGYSTSYNQQRRFWRSKGITSCPRKLFREQLMATLRQWREKGDRLVLFIDANEDMRDGPIQRELSSALDMYDAVQEVGDANPVATHQRGSRQIDGVWVTRDLQVARACFLPFHLGVGDHRAILLDVRSSSLLGRPSSLIQKPTMRRLQCWIHSVKRRYRRSLVNYCIEHRIQEKISARSGPLDNVDQVNTRGMIHAEKKSRKLRTGKVYHSPRVSDAGRLLSLWTLVLRAWLCGGVKKRTVQRQARRCGLSCPLSLTPDQVRWELARARDEYTRLKQNSQWHREQHLLLQASTTASTERAKAIKMRLRNEKSRREWQTIKRASGKTRSKSISSVAVLKGNRRVNTVGKEATEQAILNNLVRKFGGLTAGTPMMEGSLASALGPICEDDDLRSNLLKGDTGGHEIDEDLDQMLCILSGNAHRGKIDCSISRADFIQFWKGAKERTSSSPSGRHFGHYKAAVGCPILEQIHASVCDTACSSGVPLQRWKKGLNCMLEKRRGKLEWTN